MEKTVNIIGAGLAGSEAAYQLAKRGIKVKLYEMRPHKDAKAHHSDKFAELVCSNSLKSDLITNASGLLKHELRMLDSLIIKSAVETQVPAGHSLSVDREKFSALVTKKIKENPLIEVINEEVVNIPSGITIIATGPLTSKKFKESLNSLLKEEGLYFYDAAAPLIEASSIDLNIAYKKSRYDKGGADYLNCPMNKEEFSLFYNELVKGKRYPLHDFEKEIYFEGCKPIEVIALKGYKSLTFGPLKPVGLEKEGKRPYAVVQLRQDDVSANIYNMVGFQTNLLWSEQKRIFSLIPGLKNVNFYRYGVMHLNTFVNAPKHLNDKMQLKQHPHIFIVGQLSGVEGYIESVATGILASINVTRIIKKQATISFPLQTQIGSLINYIANANKNNFQPMNSNFGIMITNEKDKNNVAKISLESLKRWIRENGI